VNWRAIFVRPYGTLGVVDAGNSRFLTGPSALFGMTTVDLGGFYAALKRRSSTVLSAVVTHQVKIKNKVKGDGQECPSHTSTPQGLKPGSFFWS